MFTNKTDHPDVCDAAKIVADDRSGSYLSHHLKMVVEEGRWWWEVGVRAGG